MGLPHQEYIAKFLAALKQTGRPFDDAGERFGVRIEPAAVAAGEVYWRLIGLHHLTPEENQWNHNVYVEALDEAGKRIAAPPAWAGWTWEGRQPDEVARPQPLDKGENEPAGNIPLGRGQKVAVWIAGSSQDAADKSDRVANLHTYHPDEPPVDGRLLNSVGHHSFYVAFQRTKKAESGSGGGGGGGSGGGGGGDDAPAKFWTEPDPKSGGKKVILNWEAKEVKEVFLGQRAAGRGKKAIAANKIGDYLLQVVLEDGSTRYLRAGEKPEEQSDNTWPPIGTRLPTVTLTPENIALLKAFPRPQGDNGRGLHFSIDLRDESIALTVEHLVSINARWTLIYAQDELQAGRAAKACWQAGIVPVVRIGKKIDVGFDPIPYVDALKAIGAPPYVQIFNEPSDTREWRGDVTPPDWLAIFARNWAYHAARVADAGGYPGLQVLEKEELDAAIDAVAAIGRADLWKRAFFCLHNYGANHPPAYPYDLGLTVFDDFYGVLSLLAFAKWMQVHPRLGFVLPMIGGEGGWKYEQAQDPRYPKVGQPYHAQYHREMFEWFRTGLLSNGEPLPDYLFSVTPWIAGGWGADDWWGGPLGDKTETTAATRAIPPFVRKFSWGQ